MIFFITPTLCAVFNCGYHNTRDKECSFLRIPKIITHQGEQTSKLSAERRQQWIKNIKGDSKDLTEKKIDGTRVCSAHFASGQPSALEDTTNVDWAPTVNMGHSSIKDPTKGFHREKRAKTRAQNMLNKPSKAARRASEASTSTDLPKIRLPPLPNQSLLS